MSKQQMATIKYYPHPHQMKFHYDRYKVPFRLVSAGTGGGKTYAGVFEDLSWAWDCPGSVGIIFEPTYKMINRVLIQQTLESPYFFGKPIEAHPAVYDFHKTDLHLQLYAPNDKISDIYFISLENPEAAEGSSVDWEHIDEGRLVPHFQEAHESVVRRLRGSGRGDFSVGLWVTTTPSPPDTYMFNFYENPKTKDPDAKVYRWSLLQNPYVSETYKQSILRSHSGGLQEVFVYGRFAHVGVGSFAFDYTRHVIGESNCPYKTLPKDFKIVVGGIDWGWTHPAAVLVWGFDGDGRAYEIDEFYGARHSPDTLIEQAKEFQEVYDVRTFVCGSDDPGNIDKARRNGVRAEPRKSKRQEGFMELGGRFLDAGDGKPRIFFHRRCVNTIAEVQVFKEETPENDHAIDATRYAFEKMRVGKMEVGTAKVPW